MLYAFNLCVIQYKRIFAKCIILYQKNVTRDKTAVVEIENDYTRKADAAMKLSNGTNLTLPIRGIVSVMSKSLEVHKSLRSPNHPNCSIMGNNGRRRPSETGTNTNLYKYIRTTPNKMFYHNTQLQTKRTQILSLSS